MKRVIVVGAGPAGSLAATLLARAGVGVTLVEQSRFPRDKVCGECLSALGQRVLHRNGLLAVFRQGVPILRSELNGKTTRVRLDLPEPMLGLSRSVMDLTLLNEAIAAGVRLLQPARVEALTPHADGVSLRVRMLNGNHVVQHAADLAVIADGRGNFTGDKVEPSGDLGIKTHFAGITADTQAVTLYGGVQGYGGVAPIEGDRWNAAFAVPRAAIAAVRGDIEQWWANAMNASPALAAHCRNANRLGPWLAAPLPRHSNLQNWPANVIPIGAAAWAIEPVGGEGMGSALRLAELAANAILNGDEQSLPVAFASVMRRRSLFCRLGGWLMAGDERSDLIALAGQPAIAEIAMRLIGKSPASLSEASTSAAAGRP